MIWEDLSYEDETTAPGGGDFDPYTVQVNTDLLNYYKGLIQMRSSEPALNTGKYSTLYSDDRHLAYLRELGPDQLLVLINTGDQAWFLNEPTLAFNPDEWELLMTSATGEFVPAYSGKVFKQKAG